MPDVVQYVHELADRIGPRPATTDAEAEAAEWLESVFVARGLDVERQDFECPRTYSWAFVSYHILTIASVAGAYWSFLRWPAVLVALLVAVLMWFDLDTRWGLSNLMPKGPSQNTIARRVPKVRRGERPRRVIVVAHYDSATASLAFAPALVKNFSTTFGLMKWCTALTPVLLFLHALPATETLDPYVWFGAAAVAAYLLVPLAIHVHRELFMPATDGANDNASGVAALLAVLDHFVPEGAESAVVPAPVRRAREEVAGAELLPEDAILEFAPAGTAEEEIAELPDGFRWAETSTTSQGQGTLDFDTVEFEAVGVELPTPVEVERAAESESQGENEPDIDPDPRPKGLLGRVRRGRKRRDERVGGWLGVDEDFDVRAEGKKIGSWEHFEDGEEDEGFKGGAAGGDPLTDPDYAADEAARIRRKVTESIDRSLSEKEVWFVATGAEEAGTWGMRAFIDVYGDDLRGAYIINLDNVGSGTLTWVTHEGMARRYASERRLVSTARSVSKHDEIVAKGRKYHGLSTDATPALARGFKAMSVMAFDINGRLPNWHWHTDTSANVQPDVVERAAKLVTGIIRDL